MNNSLRRRRSRLPLAFFALAALICNLLLAMPLSAQSRRQAPQSQSNRKKNQRDGEQQPSQNPDQPKPEPLPDDIVQTPQEEVIDVKTNIVNVEAVVYEKKTGRIVTGLKAKNFAVFENNAQKEITNFSTPEAPITVALVLEYSKLFDQLSGDRFEPGRFEVLRPMALFLTQFVKPPDDFVSVIAYDIRPTPITDFTNDPRRISDTINLMLRNNPAFRETNLYDAMKLTLVGGRGDSVVLENKKERTTEYAGLADLTGRRKAMILVTSGIDMSSKINYGQARKIAQSSGVPIYIIGTSELFFKRYGDDMEAVDYLDGTPGRMSMLQARNALSTFAKETGGEYFPVTFPSQVPDVLQSINALMRNQYSLGYNPGEVGDGKPRKLLVKVDVDGDGVYDEKQYIVKARQFYTPKGAPESGKKKG